MERLSPKIEKINHFDNLINRIDIDIDSSLEWFNDKQHIIRSYFYNKKYFGNNFFIVKLFETIESSKPNLESWPESMKIVDYLKQIRTKTIEELRKTQEETLKYYKLNSDRFKSEQSKEKNIKEIKSELFDEKFYFQVNFKQSKYKFWPFNVFTFVTDFYMSQSDIDSLEKLINWEKEPFGRDRVFDDKMVLTGLLFKCFIDNILNIPNHVIHVRKKDVLKIESIDFMYKYSAVNLTSSSTIDLSNIENLYLFASGYRRESVKFNIEGLCSLKKLQLGTNAEVEFSIKNLPSLTNFSLSTFSGRIDEKIVTRLLDQAADIQELHLNGKLCYLNLDNFVNLRKLLLFGSISKNFNFELFKNLCKQLEAIKISLGKIDEKTFFKLFDGYNFPYLEDLTIKFLHVKRLTKEFINRLPMQRRFKISHCKIEVIESDSFSNKQQLTSLDLSENRIELIEENAFSKLKNLKKLNLSDNKLTNFDRKFIGLRDSVEVNIENNNFNI